MDGIGGGKEIADGRGQIVELVADGGSVER